MTNERDDVPSNSQPTDWEDRLVDRALEELHGDRPPDLLPAIERALRGDRRPTAAGGANRLSPGSWLAMALAAAALFVAVLTWTLRTPTAPGLAERFEVAVVVGELAPLTAIGNDSVLRPGAPAVIALARGDRLRTAAHTGTVVDFAPFGTIRTEPGTILEVVDMDVRAKNGWVTAGSLALAVVAGGAAWHWIGERGRAEAGEVLRIESPTAGGGNGAASAQGDLTALQRENEELRQRVASLEGEARSRPKIDAPESPAAEPAVAAATAAPPATAAVFGDARYQDLLAAIDWQTMGRVAGEMGLPLVELMQKIEAGEELPMELAIKISKLNMQLVEQLPKILEAGLPGTTANGSYTHPLIVSNQLASLLANGNLPLSPAQRDAMASLVRGFAAEAQGIQDGPAELELDRVLAEVAMKDRMYNELEQQLGAEQRALVYPEGAGSFDGTSLFRSGLVWQGMAHPVNAADPAGYVESTARALTDQIELTGEAATRMRAILEQAAQSAPPETWAPSSPAERSQSARFLRAGRAMRAAQLQQAWMRRVLHEVPLTPAQREQLRTMRRVFVPLPR